MVWATLTRQAGALTSDGPEWYSGVQAWAVETGISDSLRPNDSVSREEFITMLHRASDTPPASADLSDYSDAADISDWAKEAMTWGVEKKPYQRSLRHHARSTCYHHTRSNRRHP